ncbi:MAG: hypothetical protein R3A13_06080 [Bdellovibrionota bacterium]
MKCPACKFSCSELRDTCPHCMLDLREHKKLYQIPASDPKASYQELVGVKLEIKTSTSSSEMDRSPPSEEKPQQDVQITSSIEGLDQLVKAAEQKLNRLLTL